MSSLNISAPLDNKRFAELLAKAKKLVTSRKQTISPDIEQTFIEEKPDHIDLSSLSIPKELKGPEKEEAIVEVISELISSPSQSFQSSSHLTGVAAKVTLNSKQQEFLNLGLSGEDICFVGAAGTGKTTATGQFITKLLETKKLLPLNTSTKWLVSNIPGILITSFTRKAVNNIRRAVPAALQPHVLTIHKVLEFTPEFYELYNEKTGKVHKTMKFVPQRTKFNPLPARLSVVIYEESSMIGTELYNQLSDAMPHNPQEIFIGDIRQLPPIFGPAILGFKLSLLPIIELTEVYRQALLSPIIRLAHAILDGHDKVFSPTHIIKKTPEGKNRKYIPTLDAFSEESIHGTVKFQVWQKSLNPEFACNAFIQQLIAWKKQGYYNPEQDIILCPFNRSFGTIEINKGIQNYLGQERGAEVHHIIAGFESHYLAIGDRVLYDKEDAVIIDIKRDPTYLGKATNAPHIYLDRWGTYQQNLTEQEQKISNDEQLLLDEAAIMNFLAESDTDSDSRVRAASHTVTIRYTYSQETVTLTTSSDINNLLGGNALTVHKMQGSEEKKIFLVLHSSHQVLVSNELLYTAITRAREFLHIICEPDTFYKGVKRHAVRGVTLADKIEFFKGKGEFVTMKREMDLLIEQRKKKQT